MHLVFFTVVCVTRMILANKGHTVFLPKDAGREDAEFTLTGNVRKLLQTSQFFEATVTIDKVKDKDIQLMWCMLFDPGQVINNQSDTTDISRTEKSFALSAAASPELLHGFFAGEGLNCYVKTQQKVYKFKLKYPGENAEDAEAVFIPAEVQKTFTMINLSQDAPHIVWLVGSILVIIMIFLTLGIILLCLKIRQNKYTQ